MTTLHDLTKKQLIEVVRQYQIQRPIPHLQENNKRLDKPHLEKEIEKYLRYTTRGNFTEKAKNKLKIQQMKNVRKSQKGIKKPRKAKQAEIILEAIIEAKAEEQQPETRAEENELISEAVQEVQEILQSHTEEELNIIVEEVEAGTPVQEVVENIEVLPVKRTRGRPKKNNIKIVGSGMYNMTRRDGGGLMYHFPKTGKGMRHHNNGGSIFSSIDDAMNKLSVVPGVDGIPFYNLVHQYSKIGRKLFK